MNMQIDSASLRGEANLRGWRDYCREVGEDEIPKAILHVCQAVYDFAMPGEAFAERKLKVLDLVAHGDCDAAIEAMLPQGVETRWEALRHGGIRAEIHHADTRTRVEAQGKDRASAMLGCLIEFLLSLDPARRIEVFG